ncbi:MAG TPA: S8 family serine peptidase, partial [Steroidobacteraceae bacterium]
MRPFKRAGAVALALLVGAALAAPPAAAPPVQPPRIVVAFANQPHTTPGPAGTTGSYYSGDGYRVAQSAQQQARRVAAAYSLRQVASWPIKALSMHCVVYEITDGRPVPEVLAALSKDARVVLAQPLQEFHTLTDAPAAGAPYNDPLYDLQTNLLTLGIARAHERTQGAGVRVALIDTGVDAQHPDLQGRIVRTHSFLATRAPAAPLLRHGTAMAG